MSDTVYQALVIRFKGEISDLDSLAQRISRAWKFAQTSPAEQDMFLDSVARYSPFPNVQSLTSNV